MQQKACKKFTFQTRVEVNDEDFNFLEKTASILSKVERQLFKDIYQKKLKINDLKSEYIKKYQITARQFNSCRSKLDGKIRSYQKLLDKNIANLETKIKKLNRHIKNLKDPFKIHQKKRRLKALSQKLEKLKYDKEKKVIRICFGSKKLFKKQFNLSENNYKSHAEWKRDWENNRNNSFFLIGSKDESAGNQSAQFIIKENSLSLILRFPNCFCKKQAVIENIFFAYGHEEIIRCLEENERRRENRLAKKPYSQLGTAINCLFKKDKKGWRIFVTIDKDLAALKSKKELGRIGVDINENHIAIAETDRFGNIIDKKTIPISTYGKTKNQRSALIGNASKKVVSIATNKQKPIVLENLDFDNKKQSLREKGNKYSRMLSSLAYDQIINSIKRKAFKESIETFSVNPAYTSIIGKVKFACKYGLSIHHAAALVIARRSCNYSEKPPRYIEIHNKNSRSAFFLPEKNRKKHGVLQKAAEEMREGPSNRCIGTG